MATVSESVHGMWSSRLMFILAAAGSAVGLGNIWRFPYVAGENGGGAFVLVYLLCIALIGIPIMSAEIMLGRAGRRSPINSMQALAARSGASPLWELIGWMGALAGFMILSFYGVIAGWAMYYVFESGVGTFVGATGEVATSTFNEFTGNPAQVVGWQSVFMALTVLIVARGVGEGLERTVKYLMPALFILLLVLVGYSMSTGYFGDGLQFLFGFNFEKLTWGGVLMAMGQAFFTLSLGMAAIMTYGAYMPQDSSIVGTAAMVAGLDTMVALLAGMVIFPLVFANGLESSAGPGLMFVTLPLAFGQMPGGQVFGTVFFVLVSFAAITSSISLVEPAVAWLVERLGVTRRRAAIIVGGISWFVGLGSAFSFNIWSEATAFGGMTFFDVMDYVSNNILLPVGGMLIAIFAAWILDDDVRHSEIGIIGERYTLWSMLVGVVAPLAVGIVFVMTIF